MMQVIEEQEVFQKQPICKFELQEPVIPDY